MSQLSKLEESAWRGFLRTHDSLWKTLEAIMVKDSGLTLSAYEVLLLLEEAGAGRPAYDPACPDSGDFPAAV
jgi:hypothetical protein